MTEAFLLFHLNLAYSSIDEDRRPDVIQKCYHPILDLIEQLQIPIGIELTGWTLKQIQKIDATWIQRFLALQQRGLTELIGSGYTQMIGPLVPYEVNVWNHRLGLETYHDVLGLEPELALINEMAFSTGMVEVYQKTGYRGIVMDRDNVRLALNIDDYEGVPSHAAGLKGTSMPVLWTDSLLFQKLQRYAHGDIATSDYTAFLKKRQSQAKRPLALYANDAEIFNFRPGRFKAEGHQRHSCEWQRIQCLLSQLQAECATQYILPSEALSLSLSAVPNVRRKLSSAAQPIPVKKQAKYNISRWAVTGRDNLWINTMCHRIVKVLEGSSSKADWKQLCELWASDLRTHITEKRWQQAVSKISAMGQNWSDESSATPLIDFQSSCYDHFQVIKGPDGIFLTIASEDLKVVFNMRRGLTIHELAFKSHQFKPLLGTLEHGFFDTIEFGADFYSWNTVIELVGRRERLTDLDWVKPDIRLDGNRCEISARIDMGYGIFIKKALIEGEEIKLSAQFEDWQPLQAVVRMSAFTLLSQHMDNNLVLQTVNGGSSPEEFYINQDVDHAKIASTLVTASSGFGSTTGKIVIADGEHSIDIAWDPAECAAFPMLVHKTLGDEFFTRLELSLAELDESKKPCEFNFQLSYSVKPSCVCIRNCAMVEEVIDVSA